MNRTTGFCLALIVAIQAVAARAADEDTQLWLTGAIAAPLGENVSGTLEVSQRYREGADQLLTRAGAELTLAKGFSVGAALAYVEFSGGNEFRLHQQATFTTGPFAFRSRVEERWFAGADRTEVRLRQKVTATWPVAANTRVAVAGELLYIARPQSDGAKARVDQWRAQTSLQHRLSPHLEATVGYLMIYSPRAGVPDRLSHVPQLTLTWRT